ncbi:MAG: NusA-like transcription termination signal-binding factor [Methanobacteriaceae archaeon]|nr:NusA-like transcription termination signal-binding factor [Methanobacteriaceae archaeon]
MSVKITTNEIRYIALFEKITGAMVKDCIIDDAQNKITFIVKNGEMGLAIGKNGTTIGKMQKSVDKSVEIFEHSDIPGEFIKNMLSPSKIKSLEIKTNDKGDKIATVEVDSKDKRLAIGKNGQNIQRVRQFAKRQHNISSIIIK